MLGDGDINSMSLIALSIIKSKCKFVIVWMLLAAGCAVGALFISDGWIPPLDPIQERFRGMLEAGILLTRWGLAAGAVLALLSMALWRRGEAIPQAARCEPCGRIVAGVGALILLIIAGALAAPRLDDAFWWDEINSLVRIVKRGPLTILTFSNDANNHVLNSLLMWLSLQAFGEHEAVLRMTPFLFCLAAVELFYWTLLRAGGFRIAFLGGLVAAIHPWLINHGVEVRGYAGSILFSWAAIVCFAHLIIHGSPLRTMSYIAFCVASFGCIATTIFVPIAHGAAALILFLAGFGSPSLASYRANAVNLVFACLWVSVIAILFFGFPLPQTLSYARYGASREHLPLGWSLGREILTYLTGIDITVPAVMIAGVTVLGWCSGLRKGAPQSLSLLILSSLLPLGVVLLYLLMPSTRSSARFFCFFLLPVCGGLGIGIMALIRMRPLGFLAASIVLAVWLRASAREHGQLLKYANPDLKALAVELHGKRTILTGAQADMNTYYFNQAIPYQAGKSPATFPGTVATAEFVIEGRAKKDNVLDWPDAALLAQGFRVYKTLPSAVKGRTEYVVYRTERGSGSKRAGSPRVIAHPVENPVSADMPPVWRHPNP